ncbi:hypothetical protein [Tumebacillus permanentifrigoris]|uniref:Uncharacterized protein n=1 Tax=Tumebacillus permanentifrigoris TaxID=378543 RepID=A0A316D5B7_9BACL|nr:hypothetical protein [Tumebacillus permanentifrigoris]PWK05325.1 hypothetical protein C7459_12477 [Tumebacillus permanentifrigoris]
MSKYAFWDGLTTLEKFTLATIVQAFMADPYGSGDRDRMRDTCANLLTLYTGGTVDERLGTDSLFKWLRDEKGVYKEVRTYTPIINGSLGPTCINPADAARELIEDIAMGYPEFVEPETLVEDWAQRVADVDLGWLHMRTVNWSPKEYPKNTIIVKNRNLLELECMPEYNA